MPRNWEQRDKKLEKRKNGARMRGNRSVFVIAEAEETRRQREDKEYEKNKAKRHA